ncbi:class I SAM-dependent methyltransferase [Allorhizobium undicola]|uniref:class I SAM-dependent methyltransferase n=1 Tax=Allorhizobium undicola TaxID=78527 RepID=UPI000562ABF2|nr:class I SAM-dependent methyltransferase [Allorhizobium undicola]
MATPTGTESSTSHDHHVQSQFGPRAAAYVESAVHAAGEDLRHIAQLAGDIRPAKALDLGCGGGHVAYALAAHAHEVVAVDLSSDMLAAVAGVARQRGLANLHVQQASVQALPFEDASFDFVASRFSAHHWQDVDAGLREAARVLKRASPAVFVDVIAAGRPLLDTHLQTIELLRDTSHVRNYSAAEWHEKLARAGFGVERCHMFRTRMEFASWIARMATPKPLVDAIRLLQKAAAPEVQQVFAIEPDGSFMLDMAVFAVRRC